MVSGRSDANTGRIRLGMVGGGQGAFIGAVHRLAARMDDQYEFVAGALSADAEEGQGLGRGTGPRAGPHLCRLRARWRRPRPSAPDGIEAVSIVTPNHVHVPAAMAFIEAGIHVICDKPLALNLKEAKALEKLLAKKQGRDLRAHPQLLRLSDDPPGQGHGGGGRARRHPRGAGRISAGLADRPRSRRPARSRPPGAPIPKRSGAGGCVGDIGTHTYQLLCDVSGLSCEELSADLTSFVKGRVLDDNAHVMLRFKGGAKGMIWASQVAPGNENGLKLRVYGTKGGLEWKQEDPNYLWYTPFGEPKRLITRGGAGSNAAAGRVTRVPPGHPEGYLEGFANIYTEVARAIKAKRAGKKPDKDVAFPGIADGVAGMAFIEACVKSSAKNGKWTKV